MLAKLMKYELKATGRTFLPLLGAMIAIALINRLLQLFNDAASFLLSIPRAISILVSWALLVAILVVALVMTIQRFNKNLLQNEGYLSFTLPVKIRDLILSKLFVSFIWYVACMIVLTISMILAFGTNISFSDIARALSDFSFGFSSSGQNLLVALEITIAPILGIFCSILLIYTCLSLGMMINNHRGLLAFGMFLAITTVMQLLATFAIVPLSLWIDTAGWTPFAASQFVLLSAIGTSIILCLGFFAAIHYMLRRRLNLL